MNIFFYPEEKCSMNEFHEFQMFFFENERLVGADRTDILEEDFYFWLMISWQDKEAADLG